MAREILCPDCGQPIELHSSGWWSHVYLPGDCWRLSMDGPGRCEACDEPRASDPDFCPDCLADMAAKRAALSDVK